MAESIPELHERSRNMKYRLLGKSGQRVSEAALDTMTLGDERDGDHRRTKLRKSTKPTARHAEEPS